MPKRTQSSFKGGMVSDVNDASSLELIQDMIVVKDDQLQSRGSITAQLTTLNVPAGLCTVTTPDVAFHPSFGMAMVRGVGGESDTIETASNFQLIGFPLIDSAFSGDPSTPVLAPEFATKGTNGDEVHADHADNVVDFQLCFQHAILPNEIVFAGYLGDLFKWGGSTLADYTTGTVATTDGSRVLTQTGGSWADTVEEGQYILIDGVAEKDTNGEQRAFRITKVQDDNTLEVDYPLTATLPTQAYRITSVALVQSPKGVWNPDTNRPTTFGVVCYHQDHLFVAGVANADTNYSTVFDFEEIMWSASTDAAPVGPSPGPTDSPDDDIPSVEDGYHHIDLWRSANKLGVARGHGGAIRGLVSMGDDLIVIKTSSVYKIGGVFPEAGVTAATNLKVDMLAEGIGASSPQAFAMTQRGLLIADHDGLFLYDGTSFKSLTDGRISVWWDVAFGSRNRPKTITAFKDKVYIGLYKPGAPTEFDDRGDENFPLIWDPVKDIFTTVTSQPVQCGCTIYGADDSYINDVILPQRCNVNDPGSLYIYYAADIMNPVQLGDTGDDELWGVDQSPFIITHAIPLGEDAVGEGRVNNVYINAYAAESYQVGIWAGSVGLIFDDATKYFSEGPGLKASPTAGEVILNRVFRVPFDSSEPSPATRIFIGDPFTGTEEQTQLIITAISMEYTTADVKGPTY